MRPAAMHGPVPADTHSKQKGAAANANAKHVGPQSSGSRDVFAPAVSRSCSLPTEGRGGRRRRHKDDDDEDVEEEE